MRSAATWLNPNRRMMDLLDERGPGPAAVELDHWVEGEEFVVQLDLPGVDPDRDLSLHIVRGLLVVSGDRPGDDRLGGHRERRRGPFTRQVPLPVAASADAAATYVDGVLEVRVPLSDNPIHTAVAASRCADHHVVVRRSQPTAVGRPTVRPPSTRHDGVL